VSFVSLQNSIALASVTLPASLFPPDAPTDCKLQFVAFRTGRFFPLLGNSSVTGEHVRRRTVNTPVIFVGVGEEISHASATVGIALKKTKKKIRHKLTMSPFDLILSRTIFVSNRGMQRLEPL